LVNILTVANLAEIAEVVIGDGKVSGVNENKTAVIISSENIPEFDGMTLGISQLKTLKQNIALFMKDAALEISTKENAKKEITQLELKGKNASVTFRATAPGLIKNPKGINDEIKKIVYIDKTQAQMILDAGKAMSSTHIAFALKKDNEVSIEFLDSVQNKFSIKLLEPATIVDSSASDINYFIFSIFAQLLRVALLETTGDKVAVEIGNMSAIITIGGHPIRLIGQTEV
jgi:hypothetical protein